MKKTTATCKCSQYFHCFVLLHKAGSSNTDSLPCSTYPQTYSDWFVDAMISEAEKDKDIVIVHAGMGMEPPLKKFQEKFPDKFFDVGMAEQHAVTFSAGLSCGGLKPFCIIPSAFLQRAYDQVMCSCVLMPHCICMALLLLHDIECVNRGN